MPLQQLGELSACPFRASTVQADLQPTGKPEASKGPFCAAGQLGPRSTGQEGIPQPTLLSMRMLSEA
jgi:hypothetical protein